MENISRAFSVHPMTESVEYYTQKTQGIINSLKKRIEALLIDSRINKKILKKYYLPLIFFN
jgi:hypothetical protein